MDAQLAEMRVLVQALNDQVEEQGGRTREAGIDGDRTDSVGILAAYASYLMPIFNGVQIDAGDL